MGRKPIKFTLEKRKRFLELLREFKGNVSATCRAMNINQVTPYDWRKRDPDFGREWKQVIEETTEELEREAYRRACEGTEKPVYQGGKLVGYQKEFSDTLMIFLQLKNLMFIKFYYPHMIQF